MLTPFILIKSCFAIPGSTKWDKKKKKHNVDMKKVYLVDSNYVGQKWQGLNLCCNEVCIKLLVKKFVLPAEERQWYTFQIKHVVKIHILMVGFFSIIWIINLFIWRISISANKYNSPGLRRHLEHDGVHDEGHKLWHHIVNVQLIQLHKQTKKSSVQDLTKALTYHCKCWNLFRQL